MLKSQAVADLAILLSGVTTTSRASLAISRALRLTGLADAPTIDERDLQRLLVALAAEGGPIEEVAIQIAMHGFDPPTGRAA